MHQFKSNAEYLNSAKTNVESAIQSVSNAESNFNHKIKELKATYDSFIKLNGTIESVITKIDKVNFPDRLDKIEKTVKETIEQLAQTRKSTVDELQKASEVITRADFDGRFRKLQTTVESSVKSNEVLGTLIEKQKIPEKMELFEKSINKRLEISISELQKNTKNIASETARGIHDLNLPLRIDKLDSNIAGILSSIQNVQGRIESVERNMLDKMKEISDKQGLVISSMHESNKIAFQKLNEEAMAAFKKQQLNTFITWGLIIIGVIVVIVLK